MVPRLFEHDRAYIFQNADGRIVFAIPFEGDFTLIGTTDQAFAGDPAAVDRERRRDQLSLQRGDRYFREPITPVRRGLVVRRRALALRRRRAKAQDVTRDYVLDCSASAGEAPLLTVYGGKITTYRRLAEQALRSLAPIFQVRPAWTGTRRCRAAISRTTASRR